MNEDVPQERVMKTLIEDYRRMQSSIGNLKGYTKSLEEMCQRQDDMIKELREKLGEPMDQPYSDSYVRLQLKVSKLREEVKKLTAKCKDYKEKLRESLERETELKKSNKESNSLVRFLKAGNPSDYNLSLLLSDEENRGRVSIFIDPSLNRELTPVFPVDSSGIALVYENIVSNDLGTEGEKWVMQFERDRLRQLNIDFEVRHIAKENIEGVGFDMLSVEEDGASPRYIEVKTSENGIDSPFRMTINEYEKSQALKEHYYIYRVFNFDRKERRANLMIIKGEQINMMLIELKISIRMMPGNRFLTSTK